MTAQPIDDWEVFKYSIPVNLDCGFKGVELIWADGVCIYDVTPRRPHESDQDYQARLERSQEYACKT